MKDFRDLKVWEKSHRVALLVYQLTTSFPKEERYGLISQMRRCAASVPANIAEGCGRGSDADFARFVQVAAGSASELDYHLLLAHDLDLLSTSDYRKTNEDVQEVKRMLAGLLKSLKANR